MIRPKTEKQNSLFRNTKYPKKLGYMRSQSLQHTHHNVNRQIPDLLDLRSNKERPLTHAVQRKCNNQYVLPTLSFRSAMVDAICYIQ